MDMLLMSLLRKLLEVCAVQHVVNVIACTAAVVFSYSNGPFAFVSSGIFSLQSVLISKVARHRKIMLGFVILFPRLMFVYQVMVTLPAKSEPENANVSFWEIRNLLIQYVL